MDAQNTLQVLSLIDLKASGCAGFHDFSLYLIRSEISRFSRKLDALLRLTPPSAAAEGGRLEGFVMWEAFQLG